MKYDNKLILHQRESYDTKPEHSNSFFSNINDITDHHKNHNNDTDTSKKYK